MAQKKIDDREVRRIKTTMTQEGMHQATARFDEKSPEFAQAKRDLDRKRAAGTRQRRLNLAEAERAQKSRTPKRTEAQERVISWQREQNAQNAKIRERDQQQSRARGM